MASHSSSSGSRSNSVPTSSRGSPSRQTSSNSSVNRSSPIDHQTLLTPVVRSKRTPIACTECRRRQVKCTGATPRCERCEKKGVKCEYIPCSQQKATSNGSPSSSPSQLTNGYHNATSNSSLQAPQYASSQWQSSARNHQMYMSESSMPYQQHPDWDGHASAPLASTLLHQHNNPHNYRDNGYSQSHYPSNGTSAVVSAMSRTGGAAYEQPGVVPSQAYLGTGYSQVLGTQSLSYAYDLAGSEPHIVPSQAGNYTEYYSSPSDLFDTRATGMVSEHTEKAWADPVGSAYGSFQGHYV